jgi:benzoate-CoA ligase
MAVQPKSLPPGYYNAALDLLDRNLDEGRGERVAVIDDRGRTTSAALTERANRFANALEDLGVQREQRILLVLHDSVDFPTVFLGAIKAGVVPVAVNTAQTAKDYDFLLEDCGARALVISRPILDTVAPVVERHRPQLAHVIVSGGDGGIGLEELLAKSDPEHEPARTVADDVAFWLYSSGSTGSPKGAVHLQSHLMATHRLYGGPVLGIRTDDIAFSAAKLFFAYGLGNAMTFPFAVGATAVLMAERATPASCARRLVEHRPTLFFGVPTLYAAMLAGSDLAGKDQLALRLCVSAGEALPAELGERWLKRTGVHLLDGIGSTEMLHIFISNRPDDIRYGTSGKPVPGYEARLVSETGGEVAPGEIGDLHVSGPTCCVMYWHKREKSRETFLGRWTRTGDKYRVTADGYWVYCGRSDDMLKVSGQYVSPFEVEAALLTHDDVLEAAVVGYEDSDRLVKPKAFIVLKGGAGSADLADRLKAHVRSQLAPFKYPRWIEFVPSLPKTATGKIQRFKLRAST